MAMTRSFAVGVALVTLGVLLAMSDTIVAEPVDRHLLRGLGLDVPRDALVAPPFALPDVRGMPVALDAWRGRVVVLYFWTTY